MDAARSIHSNEVLDIFLLNIMCIIRSVDTLCIEMSITGPCVPANDQNLRTREEVVLHAPSSHRNSRSTGELWKNECSEVPRHHLRPRPQRIIALRYHSEIPVTSHTTFIKTTHFIFADRQARLPRILAKSAMLEYPFLVTPSYTLRLPCH